MWLRWGICPLAIVSLVGFGCASSVGDLRQNVGLASNVPPPSRPPEPSRPAKFPEVVLVWARTAEPGDPGMMMPPSGTRVALATTGGDPKPKPEPINDPLPTPKDLPPPPPVETASTKAEEFNASANRATSRVMLEDYDDTAILLSLREQLRTDPELAELRPIWDEQIDEAITRADKLRRLRVVLLNLKQAYADATLNESTSLYENIDMVSCRRAFAMLFERFAEDAEVEVNIPPVGKRPLPEFNELCEFSHQASLAQVTFPEDVGRKRLRRLARRQFKATYPDLKLRKLAVTEKKWITQDDGQRRELRFTVGIERENAFPEDPCVLQELSIYQNKIGRRFSATECCDIRRESPMLCELLD